MMPACNSQVTSSLTAAVLDEKVATVADQKLNTPEDDVLRYIFAPLRCFIKLSRNSVSNLVIGSRNFSCGLNK